MVTDREPTDLLRVLHLLILSFSWGMQLWVSFIAGEWFGTNAENVDL